MIQVRPKRPNAFNFEYFLCILPHFKYYVSSLLLYIYIYIYIYKGEYTVPSTIGDEMTWNLFMKCREERTQSIMKSNEPENVMKLLREGKNNFKG